MTAKILDLSQTLKELSKKPSYFREYFNKPIVYHTDCLINFKLIKDSNRFAGGSSWHCRKCDLPVFEVQYFFENFDYFSIIRLFCHLGCHISWRMQEVPSTIETIADNIDWSQFERKNGILVLKQGTIIKKIYYDNGNGEGADEFVA